MSVPVTPQNSTVLPTRTIAETAKAIAPKKGPLRHYKVIVDNSVTPSKVTIVKRDEAIPTANVKKG